MILYNRIDGSSQDTAYFHVHFGRCFLEFVLELESDAANAMNGQSFVSVNCDIALNKEVEGVDQKVVNGRMIAMLDDEWDERGKEGVGCGLTVDALDNVGQFQVELDKECLFEFLGQKPLEKAIQQSFAKERATAFVAKNITKWRRLHHDVLAVVKATVGTRSQYAGNAGLVSAKGSCGSQQVALYFDVAAGKQFADDALHALAERLNASGSVEKDCLQLLNLWQERKQLVVQYIIYICARVACGIDAVGMKLESFSLGCDKEPIRLCRTTVGYEILSIGH